MSTAKNIFVMYLYDLFLAASIKVQNLGWKVLYQNPQDLDEDDTGVESPDCESDLNSIEKGRAGINTEAKVVTLETKPKPHYTNDTLLLDRKHPVNSPCLL